MQLSVQQPLAQTNQKPTIHSNRLLIGSRQWLLQLAGMLSAVPTNTTYGVATVSANQSEVCYPSNRHLIGSCQW